MQFVTFGNRIATENFNIGFFYKITFTDSTVVECTCIGIGANFVNFQREEPELLFSLTLDSASDVLSIDFLGGGGGTDDYEELDNKPQINSVELIGNKSSSDLGLQPLITNENKLSSTLVSGLGSAAASDASDFATAAQGALAATAVQPADLNAYQTKIDSSHKLSADLVDDTSTTNKFATAAELTQIETNKTNISLIKHAENTSLYFSETKPTGAVGDYWISSTNGVKVYGRTDNLFDKNNNIVKGYVVNTTGVYKTVSTGLSRSAMIPVTSETTYTITVTSQTFRIAFYATQPVNNSEAITFSTDDGESYGSHTHTYTAPATATYMVLFCYSENGEGQSHTQDEIFNTLMINEGGTALPYAPYYDWQ